MEGVGSHAIGVVGLPANVVVTGPLGGRHARAHRRTRLWAARDRLSGRDAVLKVQRGPGAAARIEVEARALARLAGHPAVVVLLAVGTNGDDEAWILTERCGSSLSEIVTATAQELRSWGADMFDALGHAHGLGVLHGDVTPSNLLVRSGADPRAVLADFGSAVVDGVSAVLPTVGHTPRFAAPERRRGGAPTAAADVFGAAASVSDTAGRLGVHLPARAERRLRSAGSEVPARRGDPAQLAAVLRPRSRDGRTPTLR